MACTGVCCDNLEEPKALMKTGLSTILIGHVNFLLGALVHGVVLRHINLHKQARVMEYAISNVVVLTTGLLGAVVGILAIVLSKNKKSRCLTWSLFIFSVVSALMAAASSIGLIVSIVKVIINDGRSLLTHCRFPDAIGYSSVANECPFDHTRIYSTTLILWVPLIVTCFIQLVFSARSLAVCASFLRLPCCPTRKKPAHYTRVVKAVRPVQETSHVDQTEPPRRHKEPLRIYTEPPRNHHHLPRWNTAPPKRHQPPQHVSRQHQSLPPLERQPLCQPHRERSGRERSQMRAGSEQRTREQHLQRGTQERSSFWI